MTINQKDKKKKEKMRAIHHMEFRKEQEINALIFIS
jgi:hypothetical protein